MNDNLSGTLSSPADLDPAGTNAFSFLVFGDTHIGSPGGEVMKRIVQDGSSYGDSFALVAGDLSQGGLNSEFVQFKQVFTDYNFPFRAAIGNHDIYFGGWNNYKNQIGRSMYSFNADNLHVVAMDTANGTIGRQQFDWLEADLSANTQPHIVVLTHFAPWVGHYSSIFKLSSEEESAQFKDMMYRHQVDLVVAGHYHGYAEIELGGTRYIVTGGANDIMDFGERQNYVRVTINGNQMSYSKIQY